MIADLLKGIGAVKVYAESGLSNELKALGYSIVTKPTDADVCIGKGQPLKGKYLITRQKTNGYELVKQYEEFYLYRRIQ